MVTPRYSFRPFGPWLILLLCSLFAWLYTANQARAWFSAIANWQQIYIAYVNDADVCPVYHEAVPGTDCKFSTLASYWAFEESYESNIYADSKSDDDLYVQGGYPTPTAGIIGQSLGPLSTNNIFGSSLPAATTSMALSFWFYWGYSSASNQTILDLGSTGYYTWQWFRTGHYVLALASAQMDVTYNATTGWHHIVLIRDAAGAEAWVDGVSSGSTSTIYSFKNCIVWIAQAWENGATHRVDEMGLWIDPVFADANAKQAWVDALYNSGLGVDYTAISTSSSIPAYVDSAEAGTVSLPITFRCAVRTKTGESAITSAKIQYKATGTGVWTDLTPAYSSPSWTIDFFPTMTAFGADSATTSVYAKGATMLFRLYVSDGVAENADPGVDTTADGTNGWLDQWVVGATAHATNTKPGRPSQ